MKGKLLLILLISIFYFTFSKPVLAVSVTISDVPSTISDQSFSFNVSVSGAQSGTNYLRANLYPAATTKYFGYTYNGSGFVNSSDYSQYLPISIASSGNWSGTIEAKLDSSSSYYSGPGSYNLKVRRYTQSGSSYTWSNEVSLIVNLSSPTPTPTPTPSPTPTSSPTPSSTTTVSSSFTISNTPSQINSDQNFETEISLSLPNNPSSNFYLKGAFKKADGSNYFGLTKVNSDWVKNNSPFSEQYQITTDSTGNWSGKLEMQADNEDSGFSGTGDYIFKVARYTETGSGPTWSNEATINITQTETSQAEGSSNTPESSPSLSNTPSSSPGETFGKTSSPKANLKTNSVIKLASVAAATVASSSATPSSTHQTIVKNEKPINIVTIVGGLFVFVGISLSGYLYFRHKRM